MTNQQKNTATVTNQEYSSAELTVGEATFKVGEAVGKLNNPYGITNQTKNTASLTNQSKS